MVLHTVCKVSTIWLCVIWVQQHTHMHRAVTLAFALRTRVFYCCPRGSQGTQSVGGKKSIHNRTTVSRARKDDAAVCPGLQPWRTHWTDGGEHTTQASAHRHTTKQAVGTLTFCPGNGSGCSWRFWAPTAPYGQCVLMCVSKCVGGQKVRGRGLRMGVVEQWVGRWQLCPFHAANGSTAFIVITTTCFLHLNPQTCLCMIDKLRFSAVLKQRTQELHEYFIKQIRFKNEFILGTVQQKILTLKKWEKCEFNC